MFGIFQRFYNKFKLTPQNLELNNVTKTSHEEYKEIHSTLVENDYQRNIEAEKLIYKDITDVHNLPEIFHYWSNTYLKPMLEEYGIENIEHFFAKYILESAKSSNLNKIEVISIGSGNADTEIKIINILLQSGLKNFTIECLDINPHMIERGKALAVQENIENYLIFTEGDFNKWAPTKKYTAIIANQSLHHVVNLECLFDTIKEVLIPNGFFITSDMIGRNGHQRWPEALVYVQKYWQELPHAYRYNHILQRYEEVYENWDCAKDGGFEGIRAQDILHLLTERFDFYIFIPFSNIISIFIDRCFGHNFDANNEWDRNFIDRIHQLDEQGFQTGEFKPTQMLAVMTASEVGMKNYSRNLTPRNCIRPV